MDSREENGMKEASGSTPVETKKEALKRARKEAKRAREEVRTARKAAKLREEREINL